MLLVILLWEHHGPMVILRMWENQMIPVMVVLMVVSRLNINLTHFLCG